MFVKHLILICILSSVQEGLWFLNLNMLHFFTIISSYLLCLYSFNFKHGLVVRLCLWAMAPFEAYPSPRVGRTKYKLGGGNLAIVFAGMDKMFRVSSLYFRRFQQSQLIYSNHLLFVYCHYLKYFTTLMAKLKSHLIFLKHFFRVYTLQQISNVKGFLRH